jgi:membrane-associated phospholipid phosphatase
VSLTKGIIVTRYLMIVNLVVGTAGTCRATPQQTDDVSNDMRFSSTTINATDTRSNSSISQLHPDWLTSSRTDVEIAGRRLVEDQIQLWTSPAKIRLSDAEWLVPFAGITSGMMLTDRSFSKSLSGPPATLRSYQNIRTGSVATLGIASAGIYLWSYRSRDPHQRETGLLAGEAVLDSLVVTEGLKYVTERERPNQASGRGGFFQGGSSFPSSHSAAAWAAAGILAHEYPGTLTKLLSYGLASTVSITSVSSRQHFPSDVLVGSALGWLVSEYVYRTHHDPGLGGSAWSPVREIFHENGSGPAEYPGSSYVPLDSWVYRAFDLLAALGYVNLGYEGKRPWSREQCAHLLIDADEAILNSSGSRNVRAGQLVLLLDALHHEFAKEEATFTTGNESLELDSIYTRVLTAGGTVLNDGYHFGETYSYDQGRPFREGTNLISGASASATYGSLFFFVNGEFQHAPAAPALSNEVRSFIALRDKVAVPLATPFASINRFEFLDAYAGINLHGWQFSVGNQTLSWGPGLGGSLLLSNNAAPIPMLRISPQKSAEIPGVSKILGPVSFEQFFGRLDGHHGPSQPWIYGQSISMKPLRSLEFSYSRTTVIGGTGHSLTSGKLFDSVFGRVNSAENSVPGDSHTALDWTWHVPGVRHLLTFYGELEDDDDLIPVQNLAKSVLRPGIYLSRLPVFSKLDAHFEWTTSTSPGRAAFQSHGNLNYWNLDYTAGYTNDGNLLGNTVGREGITLQGWTRYWISSRNTVDFSWKQSRVLSDFVPGGGKWQDFQATYAVTKHSGVYLKTFFQIEHISSFPLLFAGSRNNVAAAIELGFLPQWAKHPAARTSSGNIHSNQLTGGSLP